MLADMPVSSRREMTEQLLTGVPDTGCAALWPWSYRVAGPMSAWPAVELYQAGSLLDVVTSTSLTAQALRGAVAVRGASFGRTLAWGRLPLRGGLPVVEFARGTFRGSRLAVPPIRITSWCWLAVADAHYGTVAVGHGGTAARCRVRASRAQW
jgi:hypothetical protein